MPRFLAPSLAVLAFLALVLTLPAPAGASSPLGVEPAFLEETQEAAAPAPICLYAISKDMCGSRLFGGVWNVASCAPSGPNCTNLVGENATFRGSWTSSPGGCGTDFEVPCDEAPTFGSLLEATVDVRSQRHTVCQARGSYDGAFKLIDSSGTTIASGDLVATLGVGTHRKACQGVCGTGICEACHDARIIDAQFNWEIGSEGTLRGRVVAGRYAGCSFTASYQGNFIADGDSRGPQVPNATWGFCGALEGVLECPCGSVVEPDI